MRAPAALSSAALAAIVAVAATGARADEASGTWTGFVELRGNYYWETSTRVVAPEVRVRLDSPEGVRLDARYLLDAITSASIAAGVQEDIRFTEVRHQGGLAASYELDLGDAQLRLGAHGSASHEPDYVATSVSAFGALSLADRATVLSAALTYVHDDVGAVVRGGEVRIDDMGRDLSDRGRQGQLEAFTAVLSWNQVLSPVATLVTTYQLVHNYGYLQNPYRRSGGLAPEVHPEARTRHTIHGRLAYYLPETSTAVHLAYRAYLDDWRIGAITPEVRLYQMLGRSAMLRLRYRYYAQVESFFYATEFSADDPFVTADQKTSRFSSHLVGVQLRLGLGFLRETPLSFLEQAWLDVSFNYWFQTSSFGNGILAQTGLHAPF